MKVLGIGNAIVDVICKVEENFLSENNLTKSTMKLVGESEFKKLLSNLKIEETIAVDTHVFRVSNRTGLAYGKNPDEVQENLYKVVPKKYLKKAGHTILLHGRYTCKARKPLCKICVIRKYCKFKNKELN